MPGTLCIVWEGSADPLGEKAVYIFDTEPGCSSDSAQHAAEIKPGILLPRPVTSNEDASNKS